MLCLVLTQLLMAEQQWVRWPLGLSSSAYVPKRGWLGSLWRLPSTCSSAAGSVWCSAAACAQVGVAQVGVQPDYRSTRPSTACWSLCSYFHVSKRSSEVFCQQRMTQSKTYSSNLHRAAR
jgi:hypothetical protein